MRAGTSICDIVARPRRQATAHPTLGMNAASINSALAGRWVNTIVRTSPIRRAMRAATSAEHQDPRVADERNGTNDDFEWFDVLLASGLLSPITPTNWAWTNRAPTLGVRDVIRFFRAPRILSPGIDWVAMKMNA